MNVFGEVLFKSSDLGRLHGSLTRNDRPIFYRACRLSNHLSYIGRFYRKQEKISDAGNIITCLKYDNGCIAKLLFKYFVALREIATVNCEAAGSPLSGAY